MKKSLLTVVALLLCFTAMGEGVGDIAQASLKAFYLIRSGVPIEKNYAGEYARPRGHTDTCVYVHASAATVNRPEGTKISSPYGWYDAGDYNKYTVNSAYSCGLMLSAYEQVPDYFMNHHADIPETSNLTADVLDEVMFNLKWLLTMQDPFDGGVYHKLTTPHFEGFIMPVDCKQKRYVVQKTVTGTLDFAAVMAQAARIYKDNADYPGFSDKAAGAAMKAYEWAKQNPTAFYHQDEMNKHYSPAITTGGYGDEHADDEWFWAATELYILTGEKKFMDDVERLFPKQMTVPSWGQVESLGLQEWIVWGKGSYHDKAVGQLEKLCKELADRAKRSPIRSTFGYSPNDYGWGCLASCCMQGFYLLEAKKYIGEQKAKGYSALATNNMRFLTGDGPTGYCFITGMGKKPAMHPHHRVSAADGIDMPVPGLLVGGPNAGQQDKESGNLKYPSNEPALSYLDEEASYASNEIAINWQASLVAFASLLDAASQQ
jgi:endoglucanase